MPLITSISGIRGTIGGKEGDNLTPIDILKYTIAYSKLLEKKGLKGTVLVGRDGRISGEMVYNLVISTLSACGINVLCLDYSTTPTLAFNVKYHRAVGGIMITASHNPMEWNALKIYDSSGEFLAHQDLETLLELAKDTSNTPFANIQQLGKIAKLDNSFDEHIHAICELPQVNRNEIQTKIGTVIIDPVNSTGALAVPLLLDKLGVSYGLINNSISGKFERNAEPLKESLTKLSEAVIKEKAVLGIAVDPDVDRLAFVDENGDVFGEENTLVAVADYILSLTNGNAVSNLSSSRGLNDVVIQRGGQYFASAVGELNVVKKMKEVQAVIGGEGNGGIIFPAIGYGRDALVGIALFLSSLATQNIKASALRKNLPEYYMAKEKIDLPLGIDIDQLLYKTIEKYPEAKVNTIDGVKFDFEHAWLHLRKSNTEPIIRIYTEATTEKDAIELAQLAKILLKSLI